MPHFNKIDLNSKNKTKQLRKKKEKGKKKVEKRKNPKLLNLFRDIHL